MDLIILSTAFGGFAISDPWLIVVVIFQSLTASHMLQTNPMTPTKTPAASGAHSFIKASCPVFPPSPSPLGSHQYAAPGLWEGRREAELAGHHQLRGLLWLPLRKERCERGWRGDKREIKTPSGMADGGEVLSSGRLVLPSVSIELVVLHAVSALFSAFQLYQPSPWQRPVLICRSGLQPRSPLPTRAGQDTPVGHGLPRGGGGIL